MANEAQIINNPTSTPEAVSTGYQRQNVKTEAMHNGIDMSYIEGGVGQCVLKISGPVDVNGILYNIIEDETFSTFAGGAGRYIIYLDGTGDNLTPKITQIPGTFDASKNAHYTAGGKRILNWLITYDGTIVIPTKIENENFEKTILTSTGTWKAMFTKIYDFICIAGGGHGGLATVTGGGYATGGGGGSGVYGEKRIYVEAGDVWTFTQSTASGGSNTFSDGTTTLTFDNGSDGGDGTDSNGLVGDRGIVAGGDGFDFGIDGQYGEAGLFLASIALSPNGADPTGPFGTGGLGGLAFSGTGASGTYGVYSGGGGGGCRVTNGTAPGGNGGTSIVIIKSA